MKFKLLIFLFCIAILFPLRMSAQDQLKVDSLNALLSRINSPSEKVDIIVKFLKDPKNQSLEDTVGIKLANRAINIAEQTNYSSGKINAMLRMGYYLYRASNYKKAMEYGQKAVEMSEDLNLEKELASSYSLIATIHTELGDFDNSSPYFFKTLKLYEKLNDEEGISHSLGDIGSNFCNQQDYGKALQYLYKSLSIAQRINYQSEVKRQYNNIAVVYAGQMKFDSSIIFLQKALEISRKIGDKFGQGIYIMNIGFNQMNLGNYNDALLEFNNSLRLFTELDNRLHMAKCYLNFGYCYYTMGKIDEGADYFKRALNEGQKHNYFSIINNSAKILNEIYSGKDDTITAYKYLLLEKVSGDSLYESKKQLLISKFELQYIYEKKELERQQAQQTKNRLMLIIIFSLAAGIAILFLVVSRQRLKSKFVTIEKEKIELEKGKIESELDFKNKELTVNLLSLIRKNEMLSEISGKLLQLERDAKGVETKEAITKISQKLRNTTDDKMLNEFSQRFQEVHAGFYEKLLKSYPDLTQNELKLCAYLRLNMSTKDIAELTNQLPATIDTARYRLRKKLLLPSSETNLVNFLSQI
jgi:tetratricopeptide (TPR) repeat protein